MKNRNLFNNIFTVIIMASLVLFLLAQFEVFGNETLESWIRTITLPASMISAICMEIVLPILDNKQLFKSSKQMKIKFIVKLLLVILAIVPLVLNLFGKFDQNSTLEFGVLAAFVVFYMAQFFINLDPKPESSDEDEEYEDDEDEDEDEDEDNFDDDEMELAQEQKAIEEAESVVEEAEAVSEEESEEVTEEVIEEVADQPAEEKAESVVVTEEENKEENE